ncbi:protein CUSTOS isoform X1 [Platichthys flesus]|uniref:protein CUSTOS isoform X1 n=1 Tax=Platichthys flesus TaxID=8260 RepID=UPI002DBA3554|nr:protein CUSTOS isoform X1 [Platichthys flesus]
MAASVKKMVGVSDESSSSSDDEALRRCQEAVWETRAVPEKEDNNVKQSKRIVVAEHEHDGNELQVSQGFRTHVAKKLGHLLDRYIFSKVSHKCEFRLQQLSHLICSMYVFLSHISETQTKSSSCVESANCDDADGEGFRLFSTSIPGQTVEEPPALVRRRPAPSSSDSDSEMEARLREAAVSLKDLLPSLTLPSTRSPPSTEPPCSGIIKKKKIVAEGEEGHVVKKKKKRKQDQEESAQVDTASSQVNAKSNNEHGNSEQEHKQVKVKRKRKKKREGNGMEETSN